MAPPRISKLPDRSLKAAWQEYLPKVAQADFDNCRRQRAWTAWKYAMWDAGLKLPTQSSDGVARCVCGAGIAIPSIGRHVIEQHSAGQ